MAERVAKYVERCERHLKEIHQLAINENIAFATSNRQSDWRRRNHERKLEQHRENYRRVREEMQRAIESNKVTAQQQGTYEPAPRECVTE